MGKLNDRQRAFVTAMLDFGGLNNTSAARAAGYDTGNYNSLKRVAHQLAHDPRIQDAIREEGHTRLNASTIMAVNTLLKIADDPTTETRNKLKAIEMILNRTGLHEKTEHKVDITKTDMTGDAMVARISLLAKNLGIDASKLLGGPTVEAQFEEVVEVDEDSLDSLL